MVGKNSSSYLRARPSRTRAIPEGIQVPASDDGAAAFSYYLVPLPSAATHIRLLELLPPMAHESPSDTPSSGSPLRCRLFAAPLRQLPPFTALSYTWGANKAERRLHVQPGPAAGTSPNADGGMMTPGQLSITPSLDEALRHIRQPSETVTLWVDQICIDQQNIPERNAQVAAMKDVYGGASQVLIWLGPATAASDLFAERMAVAGAVAREENLGRHLEAWTPAICRALNQPSGDTAYETFISKVTDALYGDGVTDEEFVVCELQAWFRRPWFTRVWVLQEFALARSTVFLCGSKSIDTRLFQQAVMAVIVARNDSTTRGEAGMASFPNSPLTFLLALRQSCQSRNTDHGPGLSLHQIVEQVYGPNQPQMFATDQRDRIYALLNMAADAGRLGIRPDYSASVTADLLYTRVARAIIGSRPTSLHILELVQFPKTITNDETATKRLPSWVPDFFHARGTISEGWKGLYAPTGNAREPCLLPTTDERILGLRGIFVDSIKLTGTVWEGHSRNGGNFRCYLDFFSEIQSICDSTPRNAAEAPGTDNRHDVAWRIMLGDLMPEPDTRLRRAGSRDMDSMRAFRELAELQVLSNQESAAGGEELRAARRKRMRYLASLPTTFDPAPRLQAMRGRRPYRTQNMGYIGMGPGGTRLGDVVVLFPGAHVPYVLRPRPDSGRGHFELVGEAYCHGIMDGEAAGGPLENIYLV